jgi:F-type H+-transporting ATPase subunit a
VPKRISSTKALVFLIVVLAIVSVFLSKGTSLSHLIGPEKPEVHLPADVVFTLSVAGLHIPITNTIIATWLTMLVIIVLALIATRRMSLVPGGLQNFYEWGLEKLLGFVESVAGHENGRRFFPVLATIFLFVIANAYLALFPGFGSIEVHGHEGEAVHLLRSAGTDINTPLALAIVSFVFVEYWGISSLGLGHYLSKFFNFKQLMKGKVMGLVDVFVGLLELLSEFIRMVSFTFRLFGNMTAGEILLMVVVFLVPWGVALPFYGLELLVGFVQALIFAGLTLVFGAMAVAGHEEVH